jgi:hypothetical protein
MTITMVFNYKKIDFYSAFDQFCIRNRSILLLNNIHVKIKKITLRIVHNSEVTFGEGTLGFVSGSYWTVCGYFYAFITGEFSNKATSPHETELPSIVLYFHAS